jgi:hypothetical protein
MSNHFLAKTMGYLEIVESSQEYLFHFIAIFGVDSETIANNF